jgi:FixJ family two-component response regulator
MRVLVKQVYIVDDDDSICRALSILLSTYGFSTKSFSNAESFFSSVAKDASGCLILDLHLPGMDGWSAQQRLRTACFKLQVVMISADKNESTKVRAIKNGALGYLQKPFHDKDLVELINRAFTQGDKKKQA